jgi:putative protease
MKRKTHKIELLAPAGNLEKLEIAICYGADAVYLAGKEFSLRSFADNFSCEELVQAIPLAHKNGVKVYLACNIFSRNFEQESISEYLRQIAALSPDAIIISDPGIFLETRSIIPEIPVHLSTQANTTNYRAVRFWQNLGVKRINLARELSLQEIAGIAEKTDVELEAFVHGAMCISYSGRCLLSNIMTDRDSNRGLCTQPCRWKYAVVEETRPGQYFPLDEDDRGTYIFNSRDICMIEHMPQLIESGLTSLKIEGRMKSINYLAVAVKVYREAIDAYYADPANFHVTPGWTRELSQISRRGYCTGFYLNQKKELTPNTNGILPSPEHLFLGKVLYAVGDDKVTIEVRNKIQRGDEIEVFSPKGPLKCDTIIDIFDSYGESKKLAQPGSRVTLKLQSSYHSNDLIRKNALPFCV